MQKPEWLTIPAPDAQHMNSIRDLLGKGELHSVCESAQCPNIGECFASRTCTFMILGDICTRNCAFCAVTHGKPHAPDPEEPIKLALTAKQLGLKHIVVTSVTRDDLADGGAGHFASTIAAIRKETPESTVEVLIPDFKGQIDPLLKVIEAAPEVINHNVETVPRLYPTVRPAAKYEQSLKLISNVRQYSPNNKIKTKSGLMLGLGEKKAEVVSVMGELVEAGCNILTIGQYLRPSPKHHPLIEYIHPDRFAEYAEIGTELGFKQVVSGPLVRSSYHAEKSFQQLNSKCCGNH